MVNGKVVSETVFGESKRSHSNTCDQVQLVDSGQGLQLGKEIHDRLQVSEVDGVVVDLARCVWDILRDLLNGFFGVLAGSGDDMH